MEWWAHACSSCYSCSKNVNNIFYLAQNFPKLSSQQEINLKTLNKMNISHSFFQTFLFQNPVCICCPACRAPAHLSLGPAFLSHHLRCTGVHVTASQPTAFSQGTVVGWTKAHEPGVLSRPPQWRPIISPPKG